MAYAKEFQKKGAEAQKAAVGEKIRHALATLKQRQLDLPAADRREVTDRDVYRESKVAKKTLDKPYHLALATEIESTLAEMNVGVSIVERKVVPRVRKSTIFEQNAELMQRVEALRYRLRTELEAKQRALDAMSAKVEELSAEVSRLRDLQKDNLPRASAARRKSAA